MHKYIIWPQPLETPVSPENFAGSICVQTTAESPEIRYWIDSQARPSTTLFSRNPLYPQLIITDINTNQVKATIDYTDINDTDQLIVKLTASSTDLTLEFNENCPRLTELREFCTALATALKELIFSTHSPQVTPAPAGDYLTTADGVIHLLEPASTQTPAYYRRFLPAEPIYDLSGEEISKHVHYEIHENYAGIAGVIYWDGKNLETAQYWPAGYTPGIDPAQVL